VASLRRARPGIIIEIRWCPADKEVAGNEKADEWAKTAVGEPDTRGVEWLNYTEWAEVRTMPFPRSLANLKRGISKKRWVEARQWAGGRTSRTGHKMPESHKPEGAVAGSTKCLASRYYQLKEVHCCIGQYLHWAIVRTTAQCWWCSPLANERPPLQGVSGMEDAAEDSVSGVQKETGRWKSRRRIRDLLADEMCSRR